MPFGHLDTSDGVPGLVPASNIGESPLTRHPVARMPNELESEPGSTGLAPLARHQELSATDGEGNSIAQTMPFGHLTVNVTIPPPAPNLPPPALFEKASARKEPPAIEVAPAKSTGSKGPLVVGLIIVLGIAAGGWYYFNGAASGAKPEVAPPINAQSTTLGTSPSNTVGSGVKPAVVMTAQNRKEVLNQLISLSRENRWTEVAPILTVIKSFSQRDSGDRGANVNIFNRAEQLLKDAQFESAISEFQKVVAADPSFAEARFGLSIAELRLRKFDNAIASLVEALLINPESGPGWLTASEVFSELGKKDAAEASLKLAVYLAQDREKALNYLRGANINVKSESFKKIIKSSMDELGRVPRR